MRAEDVRALERAASPSGSRRRSGSVAGRASPGSPRRRSRTRWPPRPRALAAGATLEDARPRVSRPTRRCTDASSRSSCGTGSCCSTTPTTRIRSRWRWRCARSREPPATAARGARGARRHGRARRRGGRRAPRGGRAGRRARHRPALRRRRARAERRRGAARGGHARRRDRDLPRPRRAGAEARARASWLARRLGAGQGLARDRMERVAGTARGGAGSD